MRIYLFKISESPPEYVVRMKDGEHWIETGSGTKKISAKGTQYLDVEFSTIEEMNKSKPPSKQQ